MGRLRRSDPAESGLRRIRCGRGFRYLDEDAKPVRDPQVLARIRGLAIPPAWKDVWICVSPRGHLQAVGTDDAGRRQYLYHEQWRAQRDAEKFDQVLDLAARLPAVRKEITARLATRGLTRDRVLAAAIRLLDLGFFRVGGEEYAKDNNTYGLATLRRDHVSCLRGEVVFVYAAKGGLERVQAVCDEDVYRVVRALVRRRNGGDRLLAYRQARHWHEVRSDEINDCLRELTGLEVSAKDFRTWHATVLASVGLAVSHAVSGSPNARRRAVGRAVREVAGYLGNTPAVCRASYIDPRVFELYDRGVTIASTLDRLGEGQVFGQLATQGAVEEAVFRLLRDTC
jgi:DNA topoisomerase I